MVARLEGGLSEELADELVDLIGQVKLAAGR